MIKKAEAKSERAEKKATTVTKTVVQPEEKAPPVDLVEVRKEISNIVGARAAELAKAVLAEGTKGQLALVKYFFEVSGLYPASENHEAESDEESLAHMLMRKLDLPKTPRISEDEEAGWDANSSGGGECGTKEPQPAQNADSGTGGVHSDERTA
jgi:hypothetical protein